MSNSDTGNSGDSSATRTRQQRRQTDGQTDKQLKDADTRTDWPKAGTRQFTTVRQGDPEFER